MDEQRQRQPELASLLQAAQRPSEAESLGDGIYQSTGVSNSYLVTSSDGDLLVNAGMPGEGERHRQRYGAVSVGPLRTIVFTQSHIDHIGGWSAFTGPRVDTIVQVNFDDVREYWRRLASFYGRRTQRLWASQELAPNDGARQEVVEPNPTKRFEHNYAFDLGGRPVELHSTPGGETTDSLVVWLPVERIAFTGNLFGPMFGHVPNLYTIRGDKIRSALAYVRSVRAVRSLQPEVLITGHGDPVRGSQQIANVLGTMADAVEFLREATIEGMNKGTDLFTLMRDITLPPSLSLAEGHGKVAWNIRAIWEDHAGWFRYESTTELYDVPARAIWPELVELVGGVDSLVRSADRHLAAGRPLQALYLLDIARSSPDSADAERSRRQALEQLLEASGRVNLSETRWLETELEQTKNLHTGGIG